MEHKVRLGDKMYALCYTVNSVCCLEELYGKALHQMLQTDVVSVRALLWCGLLHAHESWTPEDAGSVLNEALEKGQALHDIGAQCAKALQDAGFFRAAGR